MESAACTSLPPPLHTHTVKHMDTHTVVSIPWPPRGVRPVPVSAVRGINSHYWQAKWPVQVYLSRYHTPCAKQNELVKTHGNIVGEVGEIPCFDFQDSNSIETAASEFSHLHKKKASHPPVYENPASFLLGNQIATGQSDVICFDRRTAPVTTRTKRFCPAAMRSIIGAWRFARRLPCADPAQFL